MWAIGNPILKCKYLQRRNPHEIGVIGPLHKVHYLEEGSESIYKTVASNPGQDHEAMGGSGAAPPGAKLACSLVGGPTAQIM